MELLVKYFECYHLVLDFFDHDHNKTYLWFYTENPMLGSYKPIEMILLGREEKLLQFIITALDENKPTED